MLVLTLEVRKGHPEGIHIESHLGIRVRIVHNRPIHTAQRVRVQLLLIFGSVYPSFTYSALLVLPLLDRRHAILVSLFDSVDLLLGTTWALPRHVAKEVFVLLSQLNRFSHRGCAAHDTPAVNILLLRSNVSMSDQSSLSRSRS